MTKSDSLVELNDIAELGLYSFVPDERRVLKYIKWLHECTTMKQILNHVMFYILLHEKLVSHDVAMKKEFYNVILPFIQHVRKSIPINTWRDGILRQKNRIKSSPESNDIYMSK